MFLRMAPILIVPDVGEAVDWYIRVLGACPRHSLPERPPYECVSLYLDDFKIMFAAREPVRQWYTDAVVVSRMPSNFVMYLYVSDALRLCEQVRHEAQVIMEPIDQPYGIREFAVRDPFGYVLVFAEELPGEA